MADAARRLLEHIIDSRLHHLESWRAELDATAENAPRLPETVQQAEARNRQAADALADAFAEGLRRAAARRDRLLVLDDRRADEDRMADALINFLVRADLATVHSEVVEERHYRYQVAIDWAALEGTAREVGLTLEQVLAR